MVRTRVCSRLLLLSVVQVVPLVSHLRILCTNTAYLQVRGGGGRAGGEEGSGREGVSTIPSLLTPSFSLHASIYFY
jgi:hypothetical protein